MTPRLLAAPLVLAALGLAGGAAAQAGQEAIHITFGAPPSCPDARAFAREVQARTARAKLAAAGEARRRTFRVTVTQERGVSRGQLTIDDPAATGAPAVREVSGQSCAEVVSALALVSALAIDPNASTAPRAPPAEVEQPAEAPAPPPPAGAAAPAAPQPDRPPRRTPARPAEPPPAAPPSGPTRWRLQGGAHATAVGAIAPDLVPGVHVFLDATRTRLEGAEDSSGPLSPSLRLGAISATSGVIDTELGTASFRWTVGRLEGCPIAIDLDAQVTARPCLELDVGALEGSGNGEAFSGRDSRFWGDVGALLRLQWVALDLVLVEAEAGLTAPFVRYRFAFCRGPGSVAGQPCPKDHELVVHETPGVGGSLGLGVGIRFP